MAETYNAVLERMKKRFAEEAGYEADDASDIGIRLKVLAGEVFSLRTALNWLERQTFGQTASGGQLDLRAQERGLTREKPRTAVGTLDFMRTEPLWYIAHIPKGTVCATAGGVRFVTTEEGTLPLGGLKTTIPARAQEPGKNGNAAAGSVTVMVTPPPGIQSVKNSVPFTGGGDAESDGAFRERLMKSFRSLNNGANAAFYRECALRHEGVSSVGVIPREDGPGTVSLYLGGNGGAADMERVNAVREELKKLRELNVQIKVAPAAPVVYGPIEITLTLLDGVPAEQAGEETRAAVRDYFSALGVGEPVIKAALFSRIFATGLLKNLVLTVPGDRYPVQSQIYVPGTVTIR